MRQRIRLTSFIAVVALLAGGELFACGDKFLVGSRGTRYHRPKTARAAAIVIYANPSDGPALTAGMESMLTHQGHSATIVTSLEQLSSILSTRRFDVVLTAADMAAKVQQLFAGSPASAVVVTFSASPKRAKLLEQIDKAVEQHDHDLQTSRTRA